MTRADDGYLDANGGRLHWAAQGAGPAVVAIHGASADLRMWDEHVPELARSYRVIRYDMRGLGRSDRPSAPYRMSDDVAAVLDHLGEERAALVGFSTGGAVALEFAARHPDRVTALVTVGAIALPAEPAGPLADAAGELGDLLAGRERARERGDLDAAVAADLDVWASAHHGAARARLQEWGRANPYFHVMGEHEQLDGIDDGALGGITAPTLVVVGDRDVRLSLLAAEHLARVIPGARLRVFAGADHFVSSAQPAAFATALRDFLGAAHTTVRQNA